MPNRGATTVKRRMTPVKYRIVKSIPVANLYDGATYVPARTKANGTKKAFKKSSSVSTGMVARRSLPSSVVMPLLPLMPKKWTSITAQWTGNITITTARKAAGNTAIHLILFLNVVFTGIVAGISSFGLTTSAFSCSSVTDGESLLLDSCPSLDNCCFHQKKSAAQKQRVKQGWMAWTR